MAETYGESRKKEEAQHVGKNRYARETPRQKERGSYWDGIRQLEARVRDTSQRSEDKVYGVKRSERGRYSGSLVGEDTRPKSSKRKAVRGKGKRKTSTRR